MKGIYITAEGKAEIEAKIAEINNRINKYRVLETADYLSLGRINQLKEILEHATVLPVEESWDLLVLSFSDKKDLKHRAPQGVIIKPKQL